jgi:hypothetical protein
MSRKSDVQDACSAAFFYPDDGRCERVGYQDKLLAANPGTVLKIALSQIEDDAQSRDK